MKVNLEQLPALLKRAGLPDNLDKVIGRIVIITVLTEKDRPDAAREVVVSTIANASLHAWDSTTGAINDLCIALGNGNTLGGRSYHHLEFDDVNGQWKAHVGPYMQDDGEYAYKELPAEVKVIS